MLSHAYLVEFVYEVIILSCCQVVWFEEYMSLYAVASQQAHIFVDKNNLLQSQGRQPWFCCILDRWSLWTEFGFAI